MNDVLQPLVTELEMKMSLMW